MTKFKDDLRKYPWPRSTAIRAHLQRWSDDDRSEDIWRKVQRAVGSELTANDFIKFVIKARSKAGGLSPSMVQRQVFRAMTVEAHEKRIKDALKSNATLSEIADVLEAAASEFRDIDGFYVDRLKQLPVNAPSRKYQGGSQAVRAFCLELGEFFKGRCGRWLDPEVAALADIALDRETTTDQVEAYRKVSN